MKRTVGFCFLLMLLMLLTGCTSSQGDAPGAAVESYLNAIVTGDEDRVATVSCASWEETARGEVASFAGVTARLEGVTCTTRSSDNQQAVVDCQGSIVATYNNEDADFPLEGRAYQVVQEGGEWRVCGYGE